MTNYYNIQTRDEFDMFLDDANSQTMWVVDTETNGLRYYRDNYIISLSVYFPHIDVAYNLPFRHGEGHVDVHYNKSNPKGTEFHDMSWGGRTKKEVYLEYWFNDFKQGLPEDYFENLPIEWLDELKAVWGRDGVHMLFHNARFDLHMLEADGFPRPYYVEDTMVLLHTVCEDWQGMEVIAPYTYPKKDGADVAGRWATDADGTLLVKKQQANRKLKWHSAFIGLEGATYGEGLLLDARDDFQEVIVDHIMVDLDNPMNMGLVYKTAKGKQGDKQREKIARKISIDSKENMWMLPSSQVAIYAMLDVVLTWQLREHYWSALEVWDNVELYHHQNAVAYELCWRMERNGVKLDTNQAVEEIKKLDGVVAELEEMIAERLPDTNIASPSQLLPALQSIGYEVLATNKKAFEPYEADPLIKQILEYRKAKKSRDTYLKRWLIAVDYNGVVHGGMNADGTVSGRLSSSGEAGNWQNIPDRGGYTVKRAIVPYDDNWIFFALDYGQIEARVACWIVDNLLGSKCKMTELFESGVDLHQYTADMIDVRKVVFGDLSQAEICDKLGYNSVDMTEAQIVETAIENIRHIGKTCNFGLLYSGGKNMIAKELSIDTDIAAILVGKWRTLFPEFAKASRMLTKQGMSWRKTPDGKRMGMYVTQPISNRHRKIQKYPTSKFFYENGKREWFNPQEAASRKLLNNVVQGLCGYICLTSGLEVNRKYGDDKLRVFANIHDALDGYIHVDHLRIIKDVISIMEDWNMLNPTMIVELEGSRDDTWQGMSAVHDIDLWIDSKGKQGYDKYK